MVTRGRVTRRLDRIAIYPGSHYVTTQERRKKAIENIEQHFSFVGLHERYDESLIILKQLFGWGVPYYKKKNVNASKKPTSTIDTATLQVINELNHEDLDELRSEIGFLFQGSALYDSMTVRENLEFPLLCHFQTQQDYEQECSVLYPRLLNLAYLAPFRLHNYPLRTSDHE